MLENDIILNGKIERDKDNGPIETEEDSKRLRKINFFEIQEKYNYGWYIAEDETVEKQLEAIVQFKQYILNKQK